MQDRSARVFCSQLIWTRHASESLIYFAAEALRHNVIGDPQFARVPDAPRSGGTMAMASCCAGAVVKCGTQNNVIGTSRLTVSTGHRVPKTSIPHTYSRPILLVPSFASALRPVIVPIRGRPSPPIVHGVGLIRSISRPVPRIRRVVQIDADDAVRDCRIATCPYERHPSQRRA
ncbi:hypothetical protein OH76DRAFT_1192366 [Lentinus brumalis]|uniref:Uncharacterized protein n=1 Tax=Lentinus brumalis TaxID=2498619 RepID=A0A371CTM7_9APHY|nr:hypothetical protein OH76DRAFT_1192366 [Polyporus brumalis]